MAGRTEIDMKRLWELVDMGKSEHEIMAELNIRERAIVQEALQEVMREKAASGKSRGGPDLAKESYTESGERIPPAMKEDTRTAEGEVFEHRMTDEGLDVKKKADESMEDEAEAGKTSEKGKTRK